MITKRVIKVPIYDYKVIIVVMDTWEEVHKLYPELEECSACVLESDNHSTIIIPSNKLNSIVHECEHLKNCIWHYIGYTSTSDNDEVDAYLIEYLFSQVLKVINKHNLALSC